MFACSTVLLSFLFYYLIMSTIVPTTEFTQFGFFTFFSGLLSLVFAHKILHCIPIWLSGGRAKVKFGSNKAIPTMTIKLINPLSKNIYILALLSPLVIITSACAIGSFMRPDLLPYFSILTSVNFGLAFYDLTYASYLFRAPKKCFVGDYSEGIHILIKQAI